MAEPTAETRAVVERIVREEWGHVLATLVGRLRDLQLAEDVLQDALIAALEHWPARGTPDSPRAWLLQTARRKAIDLLRRGNRFQAKREQLMHALEREAVEPRESETDMDERLSLIFTCCHPALPDEARVALTLRTLGGLTTSEIARAFLVPETTMGQRLVRAKRKIQQAGIPYRVPPVELWPERLDSVLTVVYLIFNEGYRASFGSDLTRASLCDEAIRLGNILAELAPAEAEVDGLLALMLLHDARRASRCGEDGALVTLERQDRETWNRRKIDQGRIALRRALSRRRPGPYQIQAAISAVHTDAPSYEETDWRQIVGLYERLNALHPSWVVKLNQAVALSFAEGTQPALEELARLAEQQAVERYQPYQAARADLLRRAGRNAEAAGAYRRAIALSENRAEREFLEQRLAALTH